ncbi:uncharacterized protein LOC143067454 [Mytilus galloprovincialis]|uniref:uncharacterized protein LOC143067454 n=1 Tax=Mytilus galloprovincialis TaxID=29158 RepID=UPI003F7C0A24
MPSFYEKVVSVIEKPESLRTDFECQELIAWFRNKSSLFKTLKSDIVKDVIRHCIFMRTNEDNVIIRQGDSGDRLYVILKGRVSIYVVQDKENDQEIRQHVEKVLAKAKLDKLLDRTQLGQHVWTSNEGQAFGEVALIKEDCVRTASVVTDEDTDLMVVDRALYNRSVRDVLEREFHEKTEFVENNPLFKQWLPKMKKSMTIALQKETMHYGSPVVRQGQPVENIFFMLRGEAEVIADQASHKTQYPEIWGELQRILPDLLPKDNGINYTPYETLQRRRTSHRPYQMCLLGANEVVGAVEVIVGLKTHLETTTVTRESDVLVLSTNNYNRLFNRKSSARSVDMLKEMLCQRYFMYIHRSNLSVIDATFLKYLTIKMLDTESIKLLKTRHNRKNEFTEHDFYEAYRIFKKMEKENDSIISLMKILDINFLFFDTTLPELETSKKVLTDLEYRMTQWRERSKGEEKPGTSTSKHIKNGKPRRKSSSDVSHRKRGTSSASSQKSGTSRHKTTHS